MLQPLVNCCCSVSPSSSSFLLTCTTRNDLARLGMGTIFLVMIIGERSEPLSRVFNDQTSGIYIYIYMVESVRTYVSNTHARVHMSVCYLDRNIS